MFKSIDEKLEELGFLKVKNENKYGACYMIEVPINTGDSYIQRLDILYKSNGHHLIQSYEEGVNSDKLNNSVGLEYEEIKLAMKKYKELKRKYKWN